MPINTTVKGDLVAIAKTGKYSVIVHGCNCHNTMGAGIAPQIADNFQGVRYADENFYIPVGSSKRLGRFSFALQNHIGLLVVNMYTQFTFTGRQSGKIDVDYAAIREGFTRLNRLGVGKSDYKVGIPMIGAGLAGGDWSIIESIINEVTPNLDIELVLYDGGK